MNVSDKIKQLHGNDEAQLEFIFSDNRRIIVESPAGYGKTKVMISKIAYLIASGKLPNPKKILALTFSVNASYKIKKEVVQELPNLLDESLNKEVYDKIQVSNYHGLCRRILKRYGFRLSSYLRNVDTLITFNDGDTREYKRLSVVLNSEKQSFLAQFNSEVKNCNSEFVKTNFNRYNEIVQDDLLRQKVIPFNSLITLTVKLLKEYPRIKLFYQSYFKSIFIDEFQDTNLLSYGLIKYLIDENTYVYLLGDSLQRIYGFIGAIPNVLQKAKVDFQMEFITLSKNYRFKDNPEMLQLDNNIRANALNPISPLIDSPVSLKFSHLDNQELEGEYLISQCKDLLSNNDTDKISILFRSRGFNTNIVITQFDDSGLPYFYALFSDEEADYKKYHFDAAKLFIEYLGKGKFSKRLCSKFYKELVGQTDSNNPTHNSLNVLLNIFLKQLFIENYHMEEEDKIILVKETFEGLGLKQYIEFVDSRIILTTIHGAKGLEWEYVIIPDMEQNSLPSYFSCRDCGFKSNCDYTYNELNQDKLLDELSVFYVAFTRARKQVYFSASKKSYSPNGDREFKNNLSCFLSLDGITLP